MGIIFADLSSQGQVQEDALSLFVAIFLVCMIFLVCRRFGWFPPFTGRRKSSDEYRKRRES